MAFIDGRQKPHHLAVPRAGKAAFPEFTGAHAGAQAHYQHWCCRYQGHPRCTAPKIKGSVMDTNRSPQETGRPTRLFGQKHVGPKGIATVQLEGGSIGMPDAASQQPPGSDGVAQRRGDAHHRAADAADLLTADIDSVGEKCVRRIGRGESSIHAGLQPMPVPLGALGTLTDDSERQTARGLWRLHLPTSTAAWREWRQWREVASHEGAAGVAAELRVLGTHPSRFHLCTMTTDVRARRLAAALSGQGPGRMGPSLDQAPPGTVKAGCWPKLKCAQPEKEPPQADPGSDANTEGQVSQVRT